ncbi:hypothetical protein COCSADRAFT_104549 [Bipolaris sorokiniana ND90Pr]|uniref:Uncharacterized protein n=1 Tax=Cochliobolus sativus (strain ND90Pr / ATCC 201652) TaxID=665912 RepID=M2SM08_COCSN|nr:uncharacterized protein COCSADRAFT_104549 [Bipolaris sorokiniana ND90Pr]EMD58181.1 hypothetical protein COCSADRAFT_104549 [Bipolaris sorokiniana ND90Pr]
MPPKAQPGGRGQWDTGGVNALQFCSNGAPNDTITAVAAQIFAAADRALTRTTPGAVQPAVNIAGTINVNEYRVWYIFDVAVADELRRVFAAAPDIRRVFDFFCRPRGNSPYDAIFGAGLRDYSPIVARTTITARQILTGRPSYLKAFVVHTRGGLNARFCTNNCAAVLEGEKEFTAFAGCVSILGEWGGACSNCIWQDHGARCNVPRGPGGRTTASSKRVSGGSDGGGPRRRPALGGPFNPLLLE